MRRIKYYFETLFFRLERRLFYFQCQVESCIEGWIDKKIQERIVAFAPIQGELEMGRRKKVVQQMVDVEIEVDEPDEETLDLMVVKPKEKPLKEAAEALRLAHNEACQDAQVAAKIKLTNAINHIIELAYNHSHKEG